MGLFYKYKISSLFLVLVVSQCLLCKSSKSQSLTPHVIATSGNYMVNGGASLSYTIGEPMVQTLYSSKNILTQGFQQPIDTLAIHQDSVQNAIHDYSHESLFSVEVYPNPFSNYIYLKVNGAVMYDQFSIDLVNQLGQQCMIPVVIEYIGGSSTYRINTADLAMGIYILRIKSLSNHTFNSVKLNRTAYD